MQHLTNPDVLWLTKLYELTKRNYEDYPELYSKEEVETIEINESIIKGLQP